MDGEDKVLLAKNFLRNRDVGVLSTLHSINGESFPYGSICPFVSTKESKIVILISEIALHTKNIYENQRVGLTVFDMEAKNKQASGRISLMGQISKVDPKEREDYQEIEERYLTFFPEVRRYFKAHDFHFFEITPSKIHFIQTFGKIFTFSGDDFLHKAVFSKKEEEEAIIHMNEDHKDFLRKLVMKLELSDELKEGEEVKLLKINREGFFLSFCGQIGYISFQKAVTSFGDLRKAFKDLL